jgi:hypothetical protein
MSQIRVQTFDDFLPDALSYRASLLAQPFYDIRHSDGETYKHISVRPPEEIAPHLAARLGKKVSIDLALGRLNYAGEQPNNAVHTDDAFSAFAYILYLNLPEQCRGGTAFWKHKKYGWTEFPTDQEILATGKSKQRICNMLRADMNNLAAWEQIHVEEMAFNRMICFPCKQWHSRWPFEAFGTEKNEARLINVGFFSAE